MGGHDDGEAHESVVEGFFAGCDFRRVAGGEDILVATIYNIADYKIGGEDGNIG